MMLLSRRFILMMMMIYYVISSLWAAYVITVTIKDRGESMWLMAKGKTGVGAGLMWSLDSDCVTGS
jgi:hypothetical protein